MVFVVRMAAVVGSSWPVSVSSTRDPSEMRMFGEGAWPDTVRCQVTGMGVASTSDNSVWLLDP